MLEMRSQSVPLSSLTKNELLRIVSDCVSVGASQIVLDEGSLTVRREVAENENVIRRAPGSSILTSCSTGSIS